MPLLGNRVAVATCCVHNGNAGALGTKSQYRSNLLHYPLPSFKVRGPKIHSVSRSLLLSLSGRLGFAVVLVRLGWAALTVIIALLSALDEKEEDRLRVSWRSQALTQCLLEPHRTHFPLSLQA